MARDWPIDTESANLVGAGALFNLIQTIYEESLEPIGGHWLLSDVEKHLSRTEVLCVLEAREPIALLIFRSDLEESCEILFLGVDPKFRRRGIMTQMILALKRHLGPPKFLFVDVHIDNLAAQAFYIKNGFIAVNVRKGYYRDGGDGLVLRKG